MPGVIAIIIVLLAIPVAVLMSGAVASALIGQVLWKDAQVRHEGSELLELDD
jgi:hypothetical protein